jgi:hypothetical protein
MWTVVTQISTAIGLAAFIFAVALSAYSFHLRNRVRTIQALPNKDRAKILERELNQFGIKAANLSARQQYDLALRELRLRSTKIFSVTIIIIVIAGISGGVSIYSMSRFSRDVTQGQPTPPMLPPTSTASTILTQPSHMESSAVNKPSKFDNSTNSAITSGPKNTEQLIYVFSSSSRPEDEDLVEDLSTALKSKGLQVTSSRKSAAMLADVTETSISDKIRVSTNGNIVHYATAEANITATRPASSASIIFDPIVKGMAHGEDTYDVRESARAAMIEAAVGRFQTLTAR